MYTYCLFCDIRRCKSLVTYLKKHGFDYAFSPQIANTRRKNGLNEKIFYDLFPGYIFAYSKERVSDPGWMLRLNGAIRLLSFLEEGHLDGNDEIFAKKLLERKGVIDSINLLQIVNSYSVINSVFHDCKEKVIEVDRRKQRAKIEFEFSGITFSTWVACEIEEDDKRILTQSVQD